MKGIYRMVLAAFFVLLSYTCVYSQFTVFGTVTNATTGEPLPGANVVVRGTINGVATDAQGKFELGDVEKGATIVVSMVGYKRLSKEAKGTMSFALVNDATELSALEVVASRSTQESPYTFSEVDKDQIQASLGSRDVPLALNTTPSVYATNQGGGAGDARINVRGFDQRNLAIMINGVPVNDMENGWVYWSNWDGLGDAASSIQMQRGLSGVNLAVPSIGGTMNIITDPAKQERGTFFRQEYGSWNFRKSTISMNTGLLDGKFALNGTLVRKQGDGFYKGTYTDAWAYYLGTTFIASDKDRFELYAIGAPQRHGQNLYKQNIARYSQEFASSLDSYDEAAFEEYKEAGWDFNQNYNTVDEGYLGRTYDGMYTEGGRERLFPNFIMERDNFFHKPQVNLNWFHTFSDKVNWATIAYWSGGRGGGAGTYGRVETDYSFDGMGLRQWDAEIEENSNNVDSTYSESLNRSTGILRNSRNNQNTFGAISKLYIKPNDDWNITVGIDWRTAVIEHYREVRDLLGGDYFVFDGNEFDLSNTDYMKGLGDKVDYFNTNTVDWLGGYASADYTKNRLSAFGMVGVTTVSYGYTNHFAQDSDGNEVTSSNNGLPGGQIKGGILYDLTENIAAYANGGYVSKNPIFDFAINDGNGDVIENPQNEKFTSFEGGLDAHFLDDKLAFKANYYNTLWNDRTRTIRYIDVTTGDDRYAFVSGINANHSGFEFELAYQPVKSIRFDAGASFGNWIHTGDATGTIELEGASADTTYNFYLNGLYVGDAPQNQIMTQLTVMPIGGMRLTLEYRYYGKHYSSWDPTSRTALEDLDEDGEATDRPQSWQVPDYSVMDFHGSYVLPIKSKDMTLEVFAHVFNIANTFYIQEAVDNSRFNAFDNDHDADDAEVFVGLPRNYNMGVVLRF